tara:strand:+ start:192 stop:470 length:279 start_codon:yes stop_codon:yes gene_type:complete
VVVLILAQKESPSIAITSPTAALLLAISCKMNNDYQNKVGYSVIKVANKELKMYNIWEVDGGFHYILWTALSEHIFARNIWESQSDIISTIC